MAIQSARGSGFGRKTLRMNVRQPKIAGKAMVLAPRVLIGVLFKLHSDQLKKVVFMKRDSVENPFFIFRVFETCLQCVVFMISRSVRTHT